MHIKRLFLINWASGFQYRENTHLIPNVQTLYTLVDNNCSLSYFITSLREGEKEVAKGM